MTDTQLELRRILALHPFEDWHDGHGTVLWWLYRPEFGRRPYPMVGNGWMVQAFCRMCNVPTRLWRWSIIPPVGQTLSGDPEKEGET